VDVLDSVTLQRLQTLEFPEGTPTWDRVVIFSPDSRILTCSSDDCVNYYHQYQGISVVSWDLQTGGVASIIRWEGPSRNNARNTSITYSANGKMVAVFIWHEGIHSANIFIFDTASGTHIHSHLLDNHIPLTNGIWTYGESLRFATFLAETITIWEVGFTSGATPTQVETLPFPVRVTILPVSDGRRSILRRSLQLLPTPCRLAFAFGRGILVHDVRNSKHLLIGDISTRFARMSFSSDGRFFACSSESSVYLWKESPTGYVLHDILGSSIDRPGPLLSPNGESIVVFGDHTIRLLRTKSSISTPSSIPTWPPRRAQDFVLGFSPDGTLAVVARRGDNTVTVLNNKSGVLQLTINPGMGVSGLGVTENTVVVIGDNKKAITWNLPARDCLPDARVGLEDGSRTINISGPPYLSMCNVSISPDSRHIALVSWSSDRLSIYSASTGECLGGKYTLGNTPETTLWFSPDGCDVWCVRDSSEAYRVWEFSGGWNELDPGLLEPEWRTVDVEGYPWRPSLGYQVTNDWWILGPDGKRLLMLPPSFRSHAVHRVWKGQFLALLHGGLSEAVILEFDP